jgi:hypothetical protein
MNKQVIISAATIDAEAYHKNGLIIIQDYLTPESVEHRNSTGSHIDILTETKGWNPYTHVILSQTADDERLLLAHIA